MTERLLSSRARTLGQSDIRRISQHILNRSLSPIRLDIGQPDFGPPAALTEAAVQAASHSTNYTPASGTTRFREAASSYLMRWHGLEVPAQDVVVSHGATEALAACIFALADPGDEFLVPVPAFPCYRTQIQLAGGTAIGYELREDEGLTLNLDRIRSLVTKRTKAVIINSPGNPTGAVLPETQLRALAQLAEELDFMIISDEVYADLVFDGTFVSPLAVNRERVLSVWSLSKTFSLTGWRIGFVVAAAGWADRISAINSQLLSSANSVAQDVAIAAFGLQPTDVAARIDTYRSRRDVVDSWLNTRGVPHTKPTGAFYQAIPLPPDTDSFATAMALLDDSVAVVPSSAFAAYDRPFLRISLTAPADQLVAGLEIVSNRLWGENA